MCALMQYMGFMGNFKKQHFLNCLVGSFSMIVWTPAVLGVLLTSVHVFCFFCICTCSAQLSMFHMDRRLRNMLIIIIFIIIFRTKRKSSPWPP